MEPHIVHFAEFELWKGKRVLELGCGLGTDTLQFHKAGALITSFDLSSKSVEMAKQRLALYVDHRDGI